MTALTREFKGRNNVTRQDVVDLLQEIPTDRPLPDTPETRKAVIEFVAAMYGEALLELEKH